MIKIISWNLAAFGKFSYTPLLAKLIVDVIKQGDIILIRGAQTERTIDKSNIGRDVQAKSGIFSLILNSIKKQLTGYETRVSGVNSSTEVRDAYLFLYKEKVGDITIKLDDSVAKLADQLVSEITIPDEKIFKALQEKAGNKIIFPDRCPGYGCFTFTKEGNSCTLPILSLNGTWSSKMINKALGLKDKGKKFTDKEARQLCLLATMNTKTISEASSAILCGGFNLDFSKKEDLGIYKDICGFYKQEIVLGDLKETKTAVKTTIKTKLPTENKQKEASYEGKALDNIFYKGKIKFTDSGIIKIISEYAKLLKDKDNLEKAAKGLLPKIVKTAPENAIRERYQKEMFKNNELLKSLSRVEEGLEYASSHFPVYGTFELTELSE